MRLALRDRREELVKRHDRALDSDPSRSTPAFQTAVQQVAEELEEIIRSSPEAASDPVELARTHRNVAQAYDDLARGGLREIIPLAVGHYEAAQRLLRGSGANIERAKLDANYANTLYLQSGGEDLTLMEAAESRYEAALKVFEAHGLDAIGNQVREYLRMLQGQMVLARK
jgi:hypothetical protein